MSDAPPSAADTPTGGAPEGDAGRTPGPGPTAATPVGGGPAPPAGRTRAAVAWVGVLGAAVVLVLLLIFILQNLSSVRITYFTFSGSFPLGAALLLAAVGGVLFAGAVAAVRILQLRRQLRRRSDPRHVRRN